MEPSIQDGLSVEIEYTLTVDGAVVDSNQGREPVSYIHGQGQLIPGLERQLAGLHVGDRRDVVVDAHEAYGRLIQTPSWTCPRPRCRKTRPRKSAWSLVVRVRTVDSFKRWSITSATIR